MSVFRNVSVRSVLALATMASSMFLTTGSALANPIDPICFTPDPLTYCEVYGEIGPGDPRLASCIRVWERAQISGYCDEI